MSRISFQPNWKILILGRSHFERPVDAVAEFVDNSIQACMWQDNCDIHCHIFVEASTTKESTSFVVILDNGIGMDTTGITNFATFAQNQSDRGQAPTAGTDAERMFIGKFGVGAKQAGFYLGNRITLLSKPKHSTSRPDGEIYRFCLDEKKLAENGATGNAFEGVVETVNITSDRVGEWLPPELGETVPMSHPQVEALVSNHLKQIESGTAIVIRLRQEIAAMFRKDMLINFSKQLKDIYHFHLKPDEVRFGDVANNSAFQSARAGRPRRGRPVKIKVGWFSYNHYGLRGTDELILDNALTDFLDDAKIQKRRPFEIVMEVPPLIENGNLGQKIRIFGFLWYLPFEDDKEQRPSLSLSFPSSTLDESHSTSDQYSKDCIIRCYWQNRLVPFTTLKILPFMEGVDAALRTRSISSKWRSRMIGILFFDWHFHDIANNKLRFSCEIAQHLAEQRRQILYSPLNANEKFIGWLEQQCQQDQELQFFDLHPSNVSSDGRPIFNQLKYSKGVIVRTGDKVKLPLKDSLDDPHFTDVEITGFTADRVLPADKTSCFGAGKILFRRLPSELYGSKGSGFVPTKVLYKRRIEQLPDGSEKLLFDKWKPSSLSISVFQTADDPKPLIVQNNVITMITGQIFYKFGIQILLSDQSVAWSLPGLNDEKGHRYSVKAVISDDKGKVIRDWPPDWKRYTYDRNAKDDIEDKPSNASKGKRCHYSLYNISQATFGGKCGTYKLDLAVLNPDGVTIYKKPKSIEIKLLPQDIARVEVVNGSGLQMRLGDFLPSLKFKFYDKFENVVKIQEDVVVKIMSDDFEIIQKAKKQSQSVGLLKACPGSGDMYTIDGNTWKLGPNNSSVFSSSRVIRGKEFSFTLKFVSPSFARLPDIVINISVSPGLPYSILPLAPLEVKLNQDRKSLHLAVTDKWGNRVAPVESSGEEWLVKLSSGPLTFVNPSDPVMVNDKGEIVCINTITVSNDYQLDSSVVEQGLLLKSTKTEADLLDEQFISVKVIPCNVPTKLQFFRNGNRLEDGDTITCVPEEIINDVTYQVVDEIGAAVDIGSSALIKVSLDWQKRNPKQRRETLPADGHLQEIQVPSQTGVYSITATITINGVSLSSQLELDVVAGEAHKWDPLLTSGMIINAGSVLEGIISLLQGVCVLDKHGNRVLPHRLNNDVYGLEPILEVAISDKSNEMDLELMENSKQFLAKLPLTLFSEAATPGIKRKRTVSDVAKPSFIIQSPITDEIMQILNEAFHPGQYIVLKVVSAEGTTLLQPSSNIVEKIGSGSPVKLSLSTEDFGLIEPTASGSITIFPRKAMKDLKIHVFDKFGNKLDLKNYRIARLNVHLNDQILANHSVTVTNINTLLDSSVEIPDKVMNEAIAGAMVANSANPHFTLSFTLSLFPNDNSKNIELLPAQLHCKVFVPNNVTGLKVEVLDYESKDRLVRVGGSSDLILSAGSNVPYLSVTLETEDGKPFPSRKANSDCFEMKIWEISKRGTVTEEKEVNVRDFYSGSLNVIEDTNRQSFEFEPKVIPLKVASKAYRVQITFVELRLHLEKLLPKASIDIKISCGPPTILILNEQCLPRMKRVVCANNSLSEIGQDIWITVKDAFGNTVGFDANYRLTCRIVPAGGSILSSIIPKLYSADDTGIVVSERPVTLTQSDRKFKLIALAALFVNGQAKDGKYALQFSLHNTNGTLLAQNTEFTFDFTSNDTFSSKMQELQLEKMPWQSQLDHYNRLNTDREELLKRKRTICQQLKVIDPTEHELQKRRLNVERELQALEQRKNSVKRVRKRYNIDEKISAWLPNDKKKVVGQVVDLALVKDGKYVEIVSLACKKIMDAVVTQDSTVAKRAWDDGLKVISLDLISSYKPHSRQGISTMPFIGELPFDPIEITGDPQNPLYKSEPPGNPKYIVNLLQFDPREEYLRSTVFFNSLKDAIVFDEYWQAVDYRKYLIKRGSPAPTLFSMDGRQIGRDGVLDPNARESLTNLDYRFGESFQGANRMNELHEDLCVLNQFQQVESDLKKCCIEISKADATIADVRKKIEHLQNLEQNLKRSMGLR